LKKNNNRNLMNKVTQSKIEKNYKSLQILLYC